MQSQQPGPAALELPQVEVEAIAQQATESPGAQIVNWQVEPLTGGRETVSRIYRVMVQVQLLTSRSPIELPLVLKLVRKTPERCSAVHWNYWLREAEAYASGALAQLPTGLHAPRCYGVKQDEDVVWLWLEHLENAPDAQWTEAEVGAVCYELGRFNGAYLADRALPTGRWATRNWLRQYVAVTAGYIEQLPQLRDHPLVGGSGVVSATEESMILFGGTSGGPAESALTTGVYLYRIAFIHGDMRMGYAATMSLFLGLVNMLITVVVFQTLRTERS